MNYFEDRRRLMKQQIQNLIFAIIETIFDIVIAYLLMHAIWNVHLTWHNGMLAGVCMNGFELWWRIFLSTLLINIALRLWRR